MKQPSRLPVIVLALAAVLAVAAVVILIVKLRPPVVADPAPSAISPVAGADLTTLPASGAPSQAMADLGIPHPAADPRKLLEQIGAALEAGDLSSFDKLLEKNVLDEPTQRRLAELMKSPIQLRQPNPFREVGEMKFNETTRWALQLDGQPPGQDEILLDLRKTSAGWTVEKLFLPPAAGRAPAEISAMDALSVTDTFLQAVLRQDFEFALAWVDESKVSDTTLAGLCILFEEGQYRMRKHKPLRAIFQRPNAVGYLANVEAADGSVSTQFAVTLERANENQPWKIAEINLSELMSDYAKRIAGGDVYYTPLVKNPEGGQTLALYFDFDLAEMSPRTRRQLEIVSRMLLSDPGKQIKLSGHTDALGTKEYNNQLSSQRAAIVKDFLINAGVDESQIVTLARGDSQPRRPNLTESGDDDPLGRRANRRTEIYLDF